MIEYFEIEGQWWLPDNPADKVSGILKFEPQNKILLHLNGKFPLKIENIEFIHGNSTDGKPITLHDTFYTHLSNTQDYVINFIFVGMHFKKLNDISFSNINVRYAHLNEWLGIHGFQALQFDANKNPSKIEHVLPKPITIQINSSFRFSFIFRSIIPSITFPPFEETIKQFAFVEFLYMRKKYFKKVFADFIHFQNFLTLAFQSPAYPLEITGSFGKKNNRTFIKIYYQINEAKNIDNIIRVSKMLMPYEYIQNKFPSLIQNWYEKKHSFETIFIPYIRRFYNTGMYDEDQFMDLARGLDAYYRDFLKQVHTQSIHRANNRNLKKKPIYYKEKLTYIFKKHSNQFNAILKIKQYSKFAEKIVKYRNDFAHSNPISIDPYEKMKKLDKLSEKLRLIVSCIILNHHGLDEGEIEQLVSKSILYRHLLNN